MGKTRDLFKKMRDTKGRFHTKMGSIKDRNGMDLTEAEDIKKRWQEYTEEGENKMEEEQVVVEYISLHRYIRNTPSDTEVLAEHQLRADRGT